MNTRNDILISVIVPVYNVEQYLDECIESILAQTHKNIEVLLVDDGSQDKSPGICDAWARRDNRIKVLHLKNGGAGAARNAALEIISGEYFGFVDSDDSIHPEMYETMLRKAIENDADIVSTVFDEEVFGIDVKELHFDHTTAINEMLDVRVPLSTWSKLYKTEKFKNVRYQHCTAEDFLYNIDCFLRTDNIVLINKRLYNYRMNETGITHTVNQRYFDQIYIFNQVKKLLNDDKRYTDSLNRFEWRMMLHIAHVLRKSGNKRKFTNEYRMCHSFVRRNLWQMLKHPKMRWTTKVKALINVF